MNIFIYTPVDISLTSIILVLGSTILILVLGCILLGMVPDKEFARMVELIKVVTELFKALK